MRAVVQRVRTAAVHVGDGLVGRIDAGLLAFVGVGNSDGPADVQYIASKIRDLRIFPDDQGKMNRSVADVGGGVLVVSQFTLHGDCRKGRRPSFDDAAPPALAEALYEDVVRVLRESGLTVETGRFQAHMDVELINDGPVTMLLDSRKAF
jgi:D-tyrosyl-tRNA(Tyr) deacylase